MELIHEIEYDGKKYPVKEPTIKGWSELMTAKSFEDHLTMAVKLISLSTGLLESEILKANAGSVYSAAEGLIETYTENSEKFNEIITFNGKRYKFVDIKNLTFGEFVDIDDIMVKPESEKINYLPMLMALLYRELDENGHYMEYDTLRIEKTAKEFELLPVRHLNSSMVFFYLIASMLELNTRYYLWNKEWWILKARRLNRNQKTLLDGITSSFKWLKKIYLKSLTLLKSIISKPSTS
tara:strand:+ start:2856 stop:3569 length:714 start_codon:yes stop_codon:yes gene_type:complete